MEAYKITSTITHIIGVGGHGNYDEKETSHKEYYHFSKDEAIKHINGYIKECESHGIKFHQGIAKNNIQNWTAYSENFGRVYYVTLNKIDIKP